MQLNPTSSSRCYLTPCLLACLVKCLHPSSLFGLLFQAKLLLNVTPPLFLDSRFGPGFVSLDCCNLFSVLLFCLLLLQLVLRNHVLVAPHTEHLPPNYMLLQRLVA